VLAKLAHFISLVLHPLWVPTYLFAVIFKFTPSLATAIPQESMPQFLVLVFILTGIIPLVTIVVMRFPYLLLRARLWNTRRILGISQQRALFSMRGQLQEVRRNSLIQNFNLSERTERVIPFFMITIFYVAVCVMLSGQLGWESFFIIAMMTVAFTSLVVSMVTLFWKISVHSVAISSLVGFLMSALLVRAETSLLVPLAMSIIAGGFVMSSRLYLNAHTPRQVGWGSLTGFIISFVVSYWYF